MTEIEDQTMHRTKSYMLALGVSSRFGLETIGNVLSSNLRRGSIKSVLSTSNGTARKQNIKKHVDFV
jgi:hypothetical protein